MRSPARAHSLPVLRAVALSLTVALLSTGTALADRSQGRLVTASGSLASEEGRERKSPPRLTAMPEDGLSRALEAGSLTAAGYALERARSVFKLGAIRGRFGEVSAVPSEAVTSVLRDLVLRIGDLSPADQVVARGILARPDDPNGEPYGTPYSGESRSVCSEVAEPGFCIHWATGLTDPNRPPLADANSDGTPDWVATTVQTFEEVWAQQVATIGFRPPKGDSSSANPGPDARTDIYLANVGSDRIYGYCTTDDPNALNNRLGSTRYPYYDVSAYCVLDNDFSETEFRNGTPLSNMQVTAAHEFFHAIQSAYDFYEDWWMLEGTATAIEDLVYDGIDDNYQYLASSQFVSPQVPVDYSANDFSDPSFLNRYGSWVFWRFLMEHLSSTAGQVDPSVLLEVWERADSSPYKKWGDATSIRAVIKAVKTRGMAFSETFNDFGISLYVPEFTFSEASGYLTYLRANDYGRAPFARSKKISLAKQVAKIDTKIDHLSHKLFAFNRGDDLGPGGRLRLILRGAPLKRGTAMTALAVRSDNTVLAKRVSLNSDGDGGTRIGFGPDVVRVIAVLTNGSGRFSNCDKRLLYATSCGIPRDDNRRFVLKVKLL